MVRQRAVSCLTTVNGDKGVVDMEITLNGKIALVTGASRGIGRACALRLAGSGADVAVNYRVSDEHAAAVTREILSMGRRAIAVRADVSKPDEVTAMVRRVLEAFDGKIDILVNNAGIYDVYRRLVDMTDEQWNRTIDTNLKGAFHVSRTVAKTMIDSGTGGRIIGIASGAGHAGRPGQASYCASKAGLILLCKVLAIELAPFNINANSISVGFVDVGQFDSPDKKPLLDDILPRILLRRTGTPEDIASMAAFLSSDYASWITGADFRVDGGESAGRVPATDDELFA
jgi:3-oxoacyl-[acyl-carrier protein] reductase